jgi:hypothetical protein
MIASGKIDWTVIRGCGMWVPSCLPQPIGDVLREEVLLVLVIFNKIMTHHLILAM